MSRTLCASGQLCLICLKEGGHSAQCMQAASSSASISHEIHQPDVPVLETDVPATTACICSMSPCLYFMSPVFVALDTCSAKGSAFSPIQSTTAANFGRAPAYITEAARPRNEVHCIM